MRRYIALGLLLSGTSTAGAARAAEADDVFVHLEADTTSRVWLEQETESSGWVEVCEAPCDQFLLAGWYRVTGDGMRPSRVFELSAGGRVTLNARSRGSVGLATGIVLASLGGVGLTVSTVVGALTWAFGGAGAGAAVSAGFATSLSIGIVGAGLIAATAHSPLELRLDVPPPPKKGASIQPIIAPTSGGAQMGLGLAF